MNSNFSPLIVFTLKFTCINQQNFQVTPITWNCSVAVKNTNDNLNTYDFEYWCTSLQGKRPGHLVLDRTIPYRNLPQWAKVLHYDILAIQTESVNIPILTTSFPSLSGSLPPGLTVWPSGSMTILESCSPSSLTVWQSWYSESLTFWQS